MLTALTYLPALTPPAWLAEMSTGPIDTFYQHFAEVLDGTYDQISPPLVYLWRFFIVISITWMGLQWALTESPVAAQGLRRMIYLSVILFMSQHWVELTQSVAGGFTQLGVLAAGNDSLPVTAIDSPSSFGTHSFTTALTIIDKATALMTSWRGTLMNSPVILLLLLAAIGVFACGAVVVLLMLVYLLLFKIGCIVVFCLLPFGAFDKTAWIVDRPLGWVMSNGIRFFVLTLTIGLLFRFADEATGQALNTADGTWSDLGEATSVSLQLLLVNLLLLVFILMANRFAGEIAGGAASLSLGDFANRVASSGTSEPIVRATAGAAKGPGKLALGGAALGVIAAGAVWSKAQQKRAAGGAGGGMGTSPTANPAAKPVAAMLRPANAAGRPTPQRPAGGGAGGKSTP